MDGNEELNKVELEFFLKGNTSLDAVEAKKPYEWLSANGWKDIQKLNGLEPVWNDFTKNLLENAKEWKSFFDLESPEMEEIPCGYS